MIQYSSNEMHRSPEGTVLCTEDRGWEKCPRAVSASGVCGSSRGSTGFTLTETAQFSHILFEAVSQSIQDEITKCLTLDNL